MSFSVQPMTLKPLANNSLSLSHSVDNIPNQTGNGSSSKARNDKIPGPDAAMKAAYAAAHNELNRTLYSSNIDDYTKMIRINEVIQRLLAILQTLSSFKELAVVKLETSDIDIEPLTT